MRRNKRLSSVVRSTTFETGGSDMVSIRNVDVWWWCWWWWLAVVLVVREEGETGKGGPATSVANSLGQRHGRT